MEHKITASPAYDRRNEKPNYGIHPVDFFFVVKDEKGALVWDLSTGWHLDSAPDRPPSGGFLANHLYVTDPHVDFDTVKDSCDWLDGEPCMCTYSTGLKGDELFNKLKQGGSAAVFEAMEIIHKEHSK